MARLRNILGLLATLIILLSSGAHTFLGWKSLEPRIAAFGTSAELIRGLEIGWKWGGAAMVAFGIIAGAIFVHRMMGMTVSAFPAVVIGVVYALYGAWAFGVSGDPFFAIFIVPGVLLLLASWPARSNASSRSN